MPWTRCTEDHPMSLTALILAGGQSRRMGEDKAMMHGGVVRLQSLVKRVGIERCIVMCGHASRSDLFQGEVLQDPLDIGGLHRLLPWARQHVGGSILLLPCDAFLLHEARCRPFYPARKTVVWRLMNKDGGNRCSHGSLNTSSYRRGPTLSKSGCCRCHRLK